MKTLLTVMMLLVATETYARNGRSPYNGREAYTRTQRSLTYHSLNPTPEEVKKEQLRMAKQEAHVAMIKKMPKKEQLRFLKAELKYVTYLKAKKLRKAKAAAKKYKFKAEYYKSAALHKVGKRTIVVFATR